DYWIVKLNPEGDYEWDKVIGSGGTDYLKSVQVVERNIILGGESDGERSGHKSEDPRAKNSSDIWVVKLNEKGDVEWDKTMGGDKSDMGGIIYATPDAGYIVGAYSSSGRANEKTD